MEKINKKMENNYYKCIKYIKFKKVEFNIGDEVRIIYNNGDVVMISNLELTKGFSVDLEKFYSHFKK